MEMKKDNLKYIANETKRIIDENINIEEFIYVTTVSTSKIKSGAVVVNTRITKRSDESMYKYIVVIINYDRKTGLYNTLVIDNEVQSPFVTFNTVSFNPLLKIKKYLPTIISSVQSMMK